MKYSLKLYPSKISDSLPSAPPKALFSPISCSSSCSIYFSIKYGHSLVSSLFVQTFKYQQNLPSLNNLWKLYLSEISDPKACPLVRRSSVQHSSSSSSPSSVNGWLQHQTHNLMIIGTHHSLIPAYFPAFLNSSDPSTIQLPQQSIKTGGWEKTSLVWYLYLQVDLWISPPNLIRPHKIYYSIIFSYLP